MFYKRVISRPVLFRRGFHNEMPTTYGIDQYSTTGTLVSYMRWNFNIGQKFSITKGSIPFAGAVAANTIITPKIYLDDLSSNVALTVINNTNYPSKRKVIYKGTELKNCLGQNNFMLELAWTSTNPLPVALPIIFTVELWEDEST